MPCDKKHVAKAVLMRRIKKSRDKVGSPLVKALRKKHGS